MTPKDKKGEMGNRFVYWGMSFVFLRCGMLSQVWASMFWFYHPARPHSCCLRWRRFWRCGRGTVGGIGDKAHGPDERTPATQHLKPGNSEYQSANKVKQKIREDRS